MLYGLNDILVEIFKISDERTQLREGEFWALQDINLELKKGEWLGIIGPNGAGKSTLLKIISGIFPPDTGNINCSKRIGSLLEVNAGLHPILTGRENIYLKAAIMGIRQCDIDDRLDEIIRFSGLKEFIDTPVKHYSSGMQVRLGFSVSSFLKPDIFIVDEALAVGDMVFRAKCIERIQSMVSEGISVIFVSHNLGVIRELCHNAYIFNHGKCSEKQTAFNAVETYKKMVRTGAIENQSRTLDIFNEDVEFNTSARYGPREYLEIVAVNMRCPTNDDTNRVVVNDDLIFEIDILAKRDINNVGVSIRLRSVDEITLIGWTSFHSGMVLNMKHGEIRKIIFKMKNILRPDLYIVDVAALRLSMPGLIESNINEEEINGAIKFKSVGDPDYPVWQRIYHDVNCIVQ